MQLHNSFLLYMLQFINWLVATRIYRYSPQIDMEKVSVDTVKPWISQRINEILGFEDEVVIDFVFNMLETERVMLY